MARPSTAKPTKTLEQRLWDAADSMLAELVALAKRMRDEDERAEGLGLHDDEIVFYDAVAQNDAAVLELGDETLKAIARELVKAVRASTTIDWNLKDSVRAAMRSKVRKLLARYDYPPDAEAKAVELVLEQAELFAVHQEAAS